MYAPNQDKEKICFFEKLTSIIKKHVNDELDQLIQLIGHSVIKYNEFDQDLSINESLSLAGMIDLYRKNMYESIGLSRDFDPKLRSAEDVFNEVHNEKAQWMMWLTYIIKQSIGYNQEL